MKIEEDVGLLKKSIEHWKRMREWVQERDVYAEVDCAKMFEEIGEEWYSSSCPLCGVYGKGKEPCDGCPLMIYGAKEGCEPGSSWDDVNMSEKWWNWLGASGRMLEELERVLDEVRGEKK